MRASLGLGTAAVLLLLLLPASVAALEPGDRARIAAAEARGQDRIRVLVAAEPDRFEAARSAFLAAGGELERATERIGYLRGTLPTGRVEQVDDAAAVFALDVAKNIPIDDPRPQGTAAPAPQTPPGAGTPAANPYLPTQDTGAPQFTAANPTWDGRGVTVAVIDSGVDLDHPAMQTTTTGAPKVVRWRTMTHPESGDPAWLRLSGRTPGAQLGLPPGNYATGLLGEARFGSAQLPHGADLDRDGVRDETFRVAQQRETGTVYVDTDNDGSLADETGMRDFTPGNRQVGYLGTDDPATPVRERMAFVVDTHESNPDPASTAPSWVAIGLAVTEHGSHVAGVATANGLFGGSMNGAAPGADVISVRACASSDCSNYGTIEGMAFAARSGAQVANMSIGGLPALNDGNNARAELYDRLSEAFNMLIVISGGNNGPGLNTVGDPSVATRPLSVAATAARATWLSNYGVRVGFDAATMPFSSAGPREDGGLKPDLAAPGSAVSTTLPWRPGVAAPGTYTLPPGYGMLNGTSMAAPQVAGAAALLVSAHQARFGQRPRPAALRNALMSTARPLPGVAVTDQGAGLIDVAAAWELLRQRATPHTIAAEVPVDTVLSGRLKRPGIGVGIHDRENVALGEPYTRTYTLTRTTGPAEPVAHTVTLTGDAAFSAPAEVVLPLGTPVRLPVRIAPAEPGRHAALLRVDDPATPGVDLTTGNVVTVPEEPAADGIVTVTGTLDRARSRSLFVRVAPGTRSLEIALRGGGEQPGQLRFQRFRPDGTPVDSSSSTLCYVPDAGGGCPGGTARARTVTEPQPGVWEIVVEARHTSDAEGAPFTLTASAAAVTIAPSDGGRLLGADPRTLATDLLARNAGSAVRARIVGGSATSEARDRLRIAAASLTRRTLSVPPGTERQGIGCASPPRA